MTGTIVRLNDKGFGFIKPDDGGDRDVFFHARSLVDGLMYDDLREGDAVTFEVEDTDKGPNAVNVARGAAADAATEEAPAEEAAGDAEASEEAAE